MTVPRRWSASNTAMPSAPATTASPFTIHCAADAERPADLKTVLRQSVGEIEKRPPAPSVRRDSSKKAGQGE
jgi:hypothetical protein